MYHATGNEAYKKQARYFLEERGKNPAFFAEEAAKRDWKHFGMIPEDTKYNQSHATIYEQDEAVGHSVRAVYMYTPWQIWQQRSMMKSFLMPVSACGIT